MADDGPDIHVSGSDGRALSRITKVAQSETLAAINRVALPIMGMILIGLSGFFGARVVRSLDDLSKGQIALAQKVDDLHEADQVRLAQIDGANTSQTIRIDLLSTGVATNSAILSSLQQRITENQADMKDRVGEVKQTIVSIWQAISQLQRSQKSPQTQ